MIKNLLFGVYLLISDFLVESDEKDHSFYNAKRSKHLTDFSNFN